MVKMEWKKFLACMEHIKKWSDTIDDLYDNYKVDLADLSVNFIMDDLVDMLELNLGDKFETISWWCWEADFGRRKDGFTQIKREDGKVANIDSIRKLWDYLNDEEDIWETK